MKTRYPGRRRERGAIFIECLILFGVFGIVFSCGIFIHSAYFAKQKTLITSKNKAWANSATCNGGLTGDLASMGTGLADGVSQASGSYDPSSDPLSGNSNTSDVGVAEALERESVTKPAQLGGGVYTATSQAHVSCNEHPQPSSDVLSLFGWAFSEAAPGGF